MILAAVTVLPACGKTQANPDGTPNGRLVKSYVNMDGTGLKSSIHEYEYDDEGRMIADHYYVSETDLTPGKETFYEYDDDGNLTGEKCSDLSKGDSEILYEYNDAGEISRKTLIDENGESTVLDYLYTDGNLTDDGENRYEYDSDGNIIEKLAYSEDSGLWVTVQTFDYDTAGNITKEVLYLKDGKNHITYEYYDYDANGNYGKVVQNADRPDDNSVSTVRYDSHGNEILRKTKVTSPSGVEHSSAQNKYEYDEYGNILSVTLRNKFDSAFYKNQYIQYYEYEYDF